MSDGYFKGEVWWTSRTAGVLWESIGEIDAFMAGYSAEGSN